MITHMCSPFKNEGIKICLQKIIRLICSYVLEKCEIRQGPCYVYMCGTYMSMCASSSMCGVCPNCSPSYFIRQGLLLNLDLGDSERLSRWQDTLDILLFELEQTRITSVCHHAHSLWGFEDLNSGCHAL